MNPAIKAVVAVLVIALIAVVGLIIATRPGDAPQPAATPAATQTPQETATPEPTQLPDEPQATAGAVDEAQEDAQGTMYEGALAGLTEEEIAALALAEEHGAAQSESVGAEDAVD